MATQNTLELNKYAYSKEEIAYFYCIYSSQELTELLLDENIFKVFLKTFCEYSKVELNIDVVSKENGKLINSNDQNLSDYVSDILFDFCTPYKTSLGDRYCVDSECVDDLSNAYLSMPSPKKLLLGNYVSAIVKNKFVESENIKQVGKAFKKGIEIFEEQNGIEEEKSFKA